jgi:hypothetical protein
MIKKEICHHLGLKVSTINYIQQHYKFQSPFCFKKQRVHRKKNSVKTSKIVKPNKAIIKKRTKQVVELIMILMKPLKNSGVFEKVRVSLFVR